jgi:hypothetical protein
MIDTPIFQLRRELLMRNFEKVSQLFGVIEPEQVSDRSNHEHLEGDRIVFSKRVMQDRKKPEKFWLPHGMPSDDRAFAFSSRVFPKASQIKALYKLWHYQYRSLLAVGASGLLRSAAARADGIATRSAGVRR